MLLTVRRKDAISSQCGLKLRVQKANRILGRASSRDDDIFGIFNLNSKSMINRRWGSIIEAPNVARHKWNRIGDLLS